MAIGWLIWVGIITLILLYASPGAEGMVGVPSIELTNLFKPKPIERYGFVLGESKYDTTVRLNKNNRHQYNDGVFVYSDLIDKYVSKYSADKEWMYRVMNCESGGDLYAKNPSGATGLYQFMPGTFSGNAPKAGFENLDIYNAEQQIGTAAYMQSINQSSQWICK